MTQTPTHGRFAALIVAAAVALTGLGITASASAAAAPPAGHDGCLVVHAGPGTEAHSASASYLRLRLRAGRRVRTSLALANPNPYACRVSLEPAYGHTATNSGDTYPAVAPGGHCVQTSCWLSQVPQVVTVHADSRRQVRFTVTVPAHAGSGEYLAGIQASPDLTSSLAGARHGQAAAAVVARVSIGVAVIVPGPLTPRLVITGVSLSGAGAGTPTLLLHVRNVGNTWEHPMGGAHVSFGSDVQSPGVRASTILPGGVAQLPIQLSDTRQGRHRVHAELAYAGGHLASWTGSVDFSSSVHTVRRGPVAQSTVVESRLPTWLIAIVAGMVALIAALGISVFVLTRRRRHGEPAPVASAG